MIVQENLDAKFKEAFNKISKVQFKIAPDVRLKFYAYYKQATSGDTFTFNDDFIFNNESNLINAFKFNAWMQLKGITPNKAKQAYIDLVKKTVE